MSKVDYAYRGYTTFKQYFKIVMSSLEKSLNYQKAINRAKTPQSVTYHLRWEYEDDGKTKKEEIRQTKDQKYAAEFSAYNGAVTVIKGLDIQGLYDECEKIMEDIDSIQQMIVEYSNLVATNTSKADIVERLNAISAASGGSLGNFILTTDGETEEIKYAYVDENGETHLMSISELVKCFYATFGSIMSAEYQAAIVDINEGGDGVLTEEQQQDVYDGVVNVVDFARDTHAFRANSTDDISTILKNLYGDKYGMEPGDSCVDCIKKMGVDYDALVAEVEASGLLFGSVVAVADDVEEAYSMTDYLNEGESIFDLVDEADHLSDEDKAALMEKYQLDESGNVVEDVTPTPTPVETPKPDYSPNNDNDSNDGGNNNNQENNEPAGDGNNDNNTQPDNTQPAESPADNNPPGNTPDTNPSGNNPEPEGQTSHTPDTTPGGNEPASPDPGGNNGHQPDYSEPAEIRTPIDELVNYDSVIDEYIADGGNPNNANGPSIPFDVTRDYDALALEEYNNTSTEIKAAGILAAVAEANSLFDNNHTLLASKLAGMGYDESEIVEIMQDRDLTIQAFTQNEREKQIAERAEEMAKEDGKEYESKYGKNNNVNKLKNGGVEDEETLASKARLDDSVETYRTAVDEANDALATAKDLKSKLSDFTEKYGNDYTKWTDKQYEEYSKLAKDYNDAVETAKVKVEAVETAKTSYETAKSEYDDLYNAKLKVKDNVSEGMPDEEGASIIAGTNPTVDENTNPSSTGLDDASYILGDNNNQVNNQVNNPNVSSGGTPETAVNEIIEDTSMAIEEPVVEEDSVVNALNASMKTGSDALKNLGTDNHSLESVGMDVIDGASENVNVGYPVDNSIDKIDLTSPVTTNGTTSKGVDVPSQSASIGESIVSGLKKNLPVELVSLGAVLTLKGASKLIKGDTSKKYVINYDELAKYQYEKIDRTERDSYDNSVINETRELFRTNKVMLEERLKEYGYSTIDVSVISEDEQLAIDAMLDGERRRKLSEISKSLAAEDGIKDYRSRYLKDVNLLNLRNGNSASLGVDLVNDPEFDQLRNDYFNMEKSFVEFANTANKDLEELNNSKNEFNSFLVQHGNDSGKWNVDEYKTYEKLNSANIEATRAFEQSSKKLDDIGNTFEELRNRYEIEKSSKINNAMVDPTNVKQLMAQPVNG